MSTTLRNTFPSKGPKIHFKMTTSTSVTITSKIMNLGQNIVKLKICEADIMKRLKRKADETFGLQNVIKIGVLQYL